MLLSRVVAAAAAACAAALILSTHAFVAIDLFRIKIVQSPVAADGGVWTTTIRFPQVNDLRSPLALISRIHNASAETSTFSFAIGGTAICSARVPAGPPRRIDCAVTRELRTATDYELTIEGPSVGWTLDYLELATHFGSVSPTHNLVVLPGSSDRYVRPSWAWVGVASFLIFVLAAFPARVAWPRGARRAYLILGGAQAVLLAVIQCSQWLSGFRVVIAADTFAIWLGWLLAPHIALAIRWMVRRIEAAYAQSTAITRAGVVALLVFMVYGAVVRTRVRDSYHGNYSGMLLVSQRLFDRNPLFASRDDVRRTLAFEPGGGGYDGQFMYFAAFDPFLRAFKDHPALYRDVMDAAPYRFGRIGYSWLTWVFSIGRWERYPPTMIWMIPCSLALAAFVLALMAQEHGLTPALGGLVIAVPGFWPSLQSGLPEPIAAATLLTGLLSLSRGRPLLAGASFALSLLTRETGAVAVGCAIGATMMAGRRREAALVASLAGGAFLAWRLYVAWILSPEWGLQGLLYTAPNFGWPFAGLRDLWQSIAHGRYFPGAPGLSRAGIVYPLLLLGGCVMALALVWTVRNATSAAALIYAIMAICLNYAAVWLHVGNGQRVTYELFLMLALSCIAIRTYPKSLQRGLIAFWSCSIAYVFFLTFDAAYIRAALAIPF
ncbi:MAG TPA: hypothetical protein VGY48_06395 [Vicinamibacterales bacterium]|jgi:hypothetical protein|nr:hypothetical protein [Vicinamibacterales bacterium]